jgi:hypothetical protein
VFSQPVYVCVSRFLGKETTTTKTDFYLAPANRQNLIECRRGYPYINETYTTMDYSQIAEMAQKAKAYDELKPKYDALVSNLALAKGLLYPDEPYDPADQLYDPTLSPVSLDGDFVNSSEDDHPEPVPDQPARKVFTGASSDSGSWNDGPPRQKLPKRKPHISGNPHGTDQTHNPCITEDQANLASENGTRSGTTGWDSGLISTHNTIRGGSAVSVSITMKTDSATVLRTVCMPTRRMSCDPSRNGCMVAR